MPVHTESDGKGGLQPVQPSKDSNEKDATQNPSLKDQISTAAAHAAHKANPGPVIADNFPAAASKDELKKRKEELNKDQ